MAEVTACKFDTLVLGQLFYGAGLINSLNRLLNSYLIRSLGRAVQAKI